nr:unknown [Homo sapiens]
MSSYSNNYLWIIDYIIGRAHTLAASHVLLGGLPTSAAELMSIMPAEKSLSLGTQ